MTFFVFFSHHIFFRDFCSSLFSYFTPHDDSYSCFLHTIPPYMHTHMLFSLSYTLLCALETAHTAYTISFALIHHCTNSLLSLHIFVHHCTFCASLHTKTSPAGRLCLYLCFFLSF